MSEATTRLIVITMAQAPSVSTRSPAFDPESSAQRVFVITNQPFATAAVKVQDRSPLAGLDDVWQLAVDADTGSVSVFNISGESHGPAPTLAVRRHETRAGAHHGSQAGGLTRSTGTPGNGRMVRFWVRHGELAAVEDPLGFLCKDATDSESTVLSPDGSFLLVTRRTRMKIAVFRVLPLEMSAAIELQATPLAPMGFSTGYSVMPDRPSRAFSPCANGAAGE